MQIDITTVYCLVEEFYKFYEEEIRRELPRAHRVTRVSPLTMPEILTILVTYSFSYYKHFNAYYIEGVKVKDFNNKLSYNRLIELLPRALPIASVLLKTLCCSNKQSQDKFIDATSLAVCSVKRISSNKVFKDLAKLGVTTKGYFLGFKLHLVIDTKGTIVNACLTRGNCDDRSVVENLTVKMIGKLYGDKGYISADLFKKLFARGLHMITGIKKNMKNKLMHTYDKIMLRKRSLIETVFDYLKNKFNLEHTRHRSPYNAFGHIITTLIAYSLKPCKPSIAKQYMVSF